MARKPLTGFHMGLFLVCYKQGFPTGMYPKGMQRIFPKGIPVFSNQMIFSYVTPQGLPNPFNQINIFPQNRPRIFS